MKENIIKNKINRFRVNGAELAMGFNELVYVSLATLDGFPVIAIPNDSPINASQQPGSDYRNNQHL